jgi:hypothetical protein
VSSGSPTDALSAFANTALADAKVAARGDPDWRVSEAFALGWQMSEIYKPDAPAQVPPIQAGDLPDLSQLDAADWDRIGLFQLQAGISKLHEAITVAGLQVPDAEKFADRLAPLSGDARADALRQFHIDLMTTLTAADYRLGKAYGLGRALADATRTTTNYHVELQSSRTSVLARWIRDLATAFPPHASHVVASAVEGWSRWAAEPPQAGAGAESEMLPRLSRQGRLWRSLLSGEKRATDLLEQSDYLSAGEDVLKNASALAKRFLRHYLWPLVAAVVLLAAGIAVMFIAGNAAGVVSGAAAIAAGLGFGWKTIGTSLGSAASRLEPPLWGAALDDVIYQRMTPKPILEHAPRQ